MQALCSQYIAVVAEEIKWEKKEREKTAKVKKEEKTVKSMHLFVYSVEWNENYVQSLLHS